MKTNNPLFKHAQGKLGDFCFRTIGGQTHIVRRPARRTHLSEKQAAAQSKFLAASRYAKLQVSQEDTKLVYSQGITDKKQSAYLVAMSDFMNAPSVHYIEAAKYRGKVGDTITMRATDDFMVISVKVVITGLDGTNLEAGEAVPDPARADICKYKTTVTNASVAGTTITVVAYDIPGNTGSAEKVLPAPDYLSQSGAEYLTIKQN